MMNGWEKMKVATGAVATVLIPVVVVLVGQEYSRSAKEREIGAKYVELAIGVLRSPPADESYNVRQWAVEVVDRHSGVKLTRSQREDLVRTGVLRDITIGVQPRVPVQPTGDAGSVAASREQEDRVTVPNVRGFTTREAQEAFRRAGLSVPRQLEEQPDTAVVDEQVPSAGARVARGTQMEVTVAGRSAVPADRLSFSLRASP